ncbi:hypothetical protein [Pseudonocardia alaniniphila]|uniref:Uncharacterized protein n=1 Tax=Pseudonocardia alaniniphila TaxID=75291 RepID=A0ABS9TSS4_9PSEU|nr:hypothetical protein [Pseudonocardia alaniniphila]MCH6171599.1 hypothetical protein [Pseudonocardia alaniniphila]
MTANATERSYAPLTDAHLARLSVIADEDHRHFTRRQGRPEYSARRLCVTLAQGAALHRLDGTTGVKDIDVWTFYAAILGEPFTFGQRKRHVDFGVSEHGRNSYPDHFEHRQLPRWSRFAGRRVDLMIRSLPVPPEAPSDAIVDALRRWLTAGAQRRRADPEDRMPSNWWLAQKAVVLIDPITDRGQVVWPAGPTSPDHACTALLG